MSRTNSNRYSFRELKTPVESRTATRRAKEFYSSLQKNNQEEQLIPDADSASCTNYSPKNEQPRS